MKVIADDFMKQMLSVTKSYTAVILKAGSDINRPDRQQIAWEHG
jgi:hypothetical protein